MKESGKIYDIPREGRDAVIGHLREYGYRTGRALCEVKSGVPGGNVTAAVAADRLKIFNGKSSPVGEITPQRILAYEASGRLAKVLEELDL